MNRKRTKRTLASTSPSTAEAAALLKRLKSTVKQTKIAEDTGVNQGQVSRLLQGQFKSVKGNALVLCKYARSLGLDAEGTSARASNSPPLSAWLKDVGGGSPEGFRLGLDVLAAVEALVAFRAR